MIFFPNRRVCSIDEDCVRGPSPFDKGGGGVSSTSKTVRRRRLLRRFQGRRKESRNDQEPKKSSPRRRNKIVGRVVSKFVAVLGGLCVQKSASAVAFTFHQSPPSRFQPPITGASRRAASATRSSDQSALFAASVEATMSDNISLSSESEGSHHHGSRGSIGNVVDGAGIAAPTQRLSGVLSTAANDQNHESEVALLRPQKENISDGNGNSHSSDGEEVPTRNSVRFISPLLEYGYRTTVDEHESGTLKAKPLLLYLPGFDGTYLSPFLQFPELGTVFDVRCMTVSVEDRSTFDELKDLVLEYLRNEIAADAGIDTDDVAETQKEKNGQHQPVLASSPSTAESTGSKQGNLLSNFVFGRSMANGGDLQPTRRKRPVYLAGESFGGILASEVALALLEEAKKQPAASMHDGVDLKGLALINAATCYDRSRLAALGPAVAEYHNLVFPLGLVGQLLPLFADEHSVSQLLLILRAKALPSVIDTAEREAYLGRVALSLPFVIPVMTRNTMKWRLQEWLDVGCERLLSGRRLEEFRTVHPGFRVLIVAGERDAALPSIAEAERLASLLPNAMVHVVEGAGHASTCGSRVDLAALFRKCYPEDLLGGRPTAEPVVALPWQKSYHHSQQFRQAGRTEMKPLAAAGRNEYFGMEPRYDNATIGLSPLFYWSPKFYRKYKPPSSSPEL